jgi:transposase
MGMSLEQEVVLLREQVAQLLAINAQLRQQIDRQQVQIDRLIKIAFGHKSERVEGPTLFDDLLDDPIPSDTPVSPEPPEPIVLVPKRKGHGRQKNSADLPRRREELTLSEAEKACPCCCAVRIPIGETSRERLDFTPSSIFVRVLVQPTLVCRACEQAGLDPQFAKPAFPAEPVPKSGVAPGLLAQVLVSKYVDHLPLNRQVSIFARAGWPVSRTRLCDLVMKCGELLRPLYLELVHRVKQSFVIHTDDSPVTLLRPSRTAYAWLYLGDASQPYTVFDLTDGRGEEHPAKFLSGYHGFLQADGYAGYNAVHGHERHLGCWAHVRRKFVESQTSDPAKASEALAFIRTLYAVERQIQTEHLIGDNALSLRRSRAGPVLVAFGEWIEKEHRTALPKSPLGQALTYARNQWPSLGRYLGDARFTIDNNVAERAVRPLAVGRKNWLFIGGDGGLPTASVLLSLCASAKRHGLNPWAYLTDVLTQMSAKPTDLAPLLPDAWAKQTR